MSRGTAEANEPSPNATMPSTILVVEDEMLVRMAAAEQLRNLGFQVLEAGQAEEAIHILADATVDLVFSDVNMPGEMDGRALASWLHAERPHVAVLLTSGAAGNDRWEDTFLRKPYEASKLARLVRQLLDQARQRKPRELDV